MYIGDWKAPGFPDNHFDVVDASRIFNYSAGLVSPDESWHESGRRQSQANSPLSSYRNSWLVHIFASYNGNSPVLRSCYLQNHGIRCLRFSHGLHFSQDD